MSDTVLIIACGALAREIEELRRLNGWGHVRVQCLPAELHNTPEAIPAAVREKIEAGRGEHEKIFVAYADCGTGGRLDALLEESGVERLPGAHCYEFYAGSEEFAGLHEAEPGTFYLTDFLVRQFEPLVVRALGLDRHPELRDQYFRNYRRLVYLAQIESPDLEARARECARRLGLEYAYRFTGLEHFKRGLVSRVRNTLPIAPALRAAGGVASPPNTPGIRRRSALPATRMARRNRHRTSDSGH